jgi:hypothetical protein
VTDWSSYATAAEKALHEAGELFLLKKYEEGIKLLGEAKMNIDAMLIWVVSR